MLSEKSSVKIASGRKSLSFESSSKSFSTKKFQVPKISQKFICTLSVPVDMKKSYMRQAA